MKKGVERTSVILLILSLIFLVFLIVFQLKLGLAANPNYGENTTLYIWDDPDDGNDKYTYDSYCNHNWKTQAYWNVYFYVNYTKNDTGEAINDSSGNCKARFDENNTGSDFTDWVDMAYNGTSGYWEYNRSFTAKGLLDWEANCTTTLPEYENLTADDTVEIKNTEPCIPAKGPGGNLPSFSCDEDTICYYDFSTNCSDDDLNDILDYDIYEVNNQTPSNFPWFSINTSSGLIKVNATLNDESGDFDLDLIVGDIPIEGTGTASDTAILPVTITSINDAPIFTALPGITENATEQIWFNFTVTASDEENDIPFYFNLTFIENCSLANWSSRTNCTLFDMNSSTGHISFLPTNDDVGIFWINFSVTDSGSPNETNTILVVFEVINVNDLPYFTYVCDNERNATEDYLLECWINATDIDEANNLTFSSNYSWFTFNNSQPNITVDINNTNASALVSFTPNDTAVGNFSINISVKDTENSINSTVILFDVDNIHDNPGFLSIDNETCYPSLACEIYVNASDDDLWVPLEGKAIYNESLNFSSNTTLFNITKISESYDGSSNEAIGLINFTPQQGDIGDYAINITVTDNSSLTNSTLFFLTVENNTLPEWNESEIYDFNLTEDGNFYLNISGYVTDADVNDTINFSASPSNFPSFNLTVEGIINFTPIDEDVNFHSFDIIASDGKGNSPHTFTFDVSNVNDTPILSSISDMETEEGNQTLIYFYAQDDDLLIQNKTVYNESLDFSKNITNLTGPYRDLFNITILNVTGNKTWALISFTPIQEDVGTYTVTINVTDNTSLINSTAFNLTIIDVNNTPEFTENISTQSAGVDILFTMNVSAIDEDNDTLIFYSDTDWFVFNNSQTNITVIPENKTSYTKINFTPNSSIAGTHTIELNVSDGSYSDTSIFEINIYDEPTIVGLNCYDVSENETFYCTGIINQAVAGTIDCTLTLGNKINNTSCPISNFNITIKTNYTDEGAYTAVMNISNPFYSANDNKSVIINHANAPPEFLTDINDREISGFSTTINLSNHFYDVDHDDPTYNQEINFSWLQFGNRTACESNGGSVSILNINVSSPDNYSYIATISTTESASAIVKITATDYDNENYSASSNCFLANFTVSAEPTRPITVTRKKAEPVTLEIITPGPVSIDAIGSIIVKVKVKNTGEVVVNSIFLSALINRANVKLQLSKTKIDSLTVDEEEEFSLIITANAPEVIDVEATEITVFAKSDNPEISASGKILLNLLEHNRALRLKAEEKQNILREYMSSNPECLELTESLEQSLKAFQERNYTKAMDISEAAIQACKGWIAKEISLDRPIRERWPTTAFILIGSAIGVFIAVFSSYYFVKRKKFK